MKSCILFTFLLVSQLFADMPLIPRGATWKFLDDGSDQGSKWTAPDFDDSAWKAGAAPLGYGDKDGIGTKLGFGSDSGKKFTTSYFRRKFAIKDPSEIFGLRMTLRRDDGAVVYLNGHEIRRSGMPKGKVRHDTFAKTTASGAAETHYEAFSADPKFLVEGENTLAVEVHQSTPKSSDIVFDLDLSIDAGSLTRGPYLQQASDKGVIIRWRSSQAVIGVVRYGRTPDELTRTASEKQATTEHAVSICGLTPSSTWYYSVGDPATTLAGGDPNYQFTTSPPPGKALDSRIWILGDCGTANHDQHAVRDAFRKFTARRVPDVILLLGDNAYNTGTDAEYQAAIFNTYPETLRRVPVWSTLGNHETGQSRDPNGRYPYFDIFTLPTKGEAGGVPSGTEHYYSFDRGNLHFICLDSMTADRSPAGAMATWLKADLASTTATWIIAFWHHPPYTKGSHDSDLEPELIEMRQNFLPILEAGGVDLALSGHSHSYERSFLLDGHYGLSKTLTAAMKKDAGSGRQDGGGAYTKPLTGGRAHHGAVYAVAGSSGKTSGGSLDHPAMFISINKLGSLVLDVGADRLDATFVQPKGNGFTIPDTFTILKK